MVSSCFNPLQGDSVSSVGFYGCVGGVSLLQSLAGGQWFIGSVFVSMSGRYGSNMAMWFGVSLGGSVVFHCFNPLQVDSGSSARCFIGVRWCFHINKICIMFNSINLCLCYSRPLLHRLGGFQWWAVHSYFTLIVQIKKGGRRGRCCLLYPKASPVVVARFCRFGQYV